MRTKALLIAVSVALCSNLLAITPSAALAASLNECTTYIYAPPTLPAPRVFVPPAGAVDFRLDVNIARVHDCPLPPYPVLAVKFHKAGESDDAAWHNATVTEQLEQLDKEVGLESGAGLIAQIPVASTDPTGTWTYVATLTRNGEVLDTKTRTFPVEAGPKAALTVTPKDVQLMRGGEASAQVAAKLENVDNVTDAHVENTASSATKTLSTTIGSDGYLRDKVTFGEDSTTGIWKLKITVKRYDKLFTFSTDFTVSTAKKLSSKITISGASEVEKGDTTRLSGRVTRGGNPWTGKTVYIYFRQKGTKSWKLVGKTTSSAISGRYARTVTPKRDGYWCAKVFADSTTFGALSKYKFVDVL
ncbi:hypothetical protein N5079_06165 [Planotetraspora sp. A-T 1434]|uniref:hypothetical protein n=1 Tax=Planotetraspora sp. A-T 1434 TaxID=2979219 RepID=UPI0021BF56BC|nr:hypothetical protein [Planotetraspora sp. A-T 1434]MCT9929803.1 hypothetical protein [Planotetraspora sp. A-T 1434]